MHVAGDRLVLAAPGEFPLAAGTRFIVRAALAQTRLPGWGCLGRLGRYRLPPYQTRARRLVGLVLLAGLAAGASPERSWSVAQIESYLAQAKIVEQRPLAEGVTNATLATLSDGTVRHDAQIQQVDISQPRYATSHGVERDFRDYWGYNIAAYRLSRLLNLECVPVSVRREIDGKGAAVTWWIDDVLMTEKTRYLRKLRPPDVQAWNRQMYTVWVFDQLIANTDRNLGNLVITSGWKIWMIDHTRAFGLPSSLENPQHLVRCERGLLEAMRRLEPVTLGREIGQYVTADRIEALLARRDKIVEYFDRQIAVRGEARVLFDAARP